MLFPISIELVFYKIDKSLNAMTYGDHLTIFVMKFDHIQLLKVSALLVSIFQLLQTTHCSCFITNPKHQFYSQFQEAIAKSLIANLISTLKQFLWKVMYGCLDCYWNFLLRSMSKHPQTISMEIDKRSLQLLCSLLKSKVICF